MLCDIIELYKRIGAIAMSVLDGFKSFNLNEGVPYISVTRNGLTFNKAVIMKLGYPSHVVLLINEDSHQIAVQVCDDKTENSAAFYKSERQTKVLSVRWNSKDLLNTIKNMMEWDLEIYSYRVNGTFFKDESAMIFDLHEATIMRG